MCRFLRQVLSLYELAPHQVVVNANRIISLVIKLREDNNIRFFVHDLFPAYTMSRNQTYSRYYFMIQPEYPYLIDKLYDSERWANEFLVVKGNYMSKSEDVRLWSIP